MTWPPFFRDPPSYKRPTFGLSGLLSRQLAAEMAVGQNQWDPIFSGHHPFWELLWWGLNRMFTEGTGFGF